MNAIKTVMITFVLFVMSFGLVTASELATKDEVVQKCIEVGKIISTKGVDEAIRQVNDTSGSFVWKDTYVYLMDLEATILAHGPQPKFIGKNLMGLKDPITKKPWYPALYKKIKAGANSGWFDYHWKKPNAKGIYVKNCYYERHGDVVIFSGIYGEKVK